MSSTKLWRAVDQQAAAWRLVPVVQRFAAPLPDNAGSVRAGLSALLEQVEAGGGRVRGAPLRLHAGMPYYLRFPDLPLGGVQGALATWLRDVERVDGAHRHTIAWLRSRLPGYPALHAPQLARGTVFTSQELGYELAWAVGERSRGLRDEVEPLHAAAMLELTAEQASRLGEAAESISIELQASAAWSRLERATNALDDAGREQLRAVRQKVAARLGPAAVDANASPLFLERDAYRRAVLSDEMKVLTGKAREYAEAFGAANYLIDFAASDVFGQLVAYGPPADVGRPEDLAFAPSGTVTFTLKKGLMLRSGMLVRLCDPLLPDALRVSHLIVNYDRAVGLCQTITGEPLVGSSATWTAAGAPSDAAPAE